LKVLLVNPPAKYTILGNNPAIIDEGRGLNPPIGLLYAAAGVRGHDLSVLDAQDMDYVELRSRLAAAAPAVVGITTMTFTLVDVAETVRAAREVCPGCRVVLGGIHTHLYPRESLDLPGVDYLLVGEGERSFPLLLDAIALGREPREIPGVAYRKDGEIRFTPPALIDDLDSLPFPARELLPVGRYSSVVARRNPVSIMVTSRGCPFQCIFCNRPHLGKRWRARSSENVVAELRECKALGIGEVLFYDDTFNIDRKRVVAICNAILKEKLDIAWDIRARVDLVDEEMLRTLREAGCQRIHFGVEASSDESLRTLRKGYTIEQVKIAFELSRRVGIETLAYFMIGIPGEGRREAERTIEFAARLGADYAHITILTPFPGTELYRMALERGLYREDYWLEFARRPSPDFRPRYWDEQLSGEELEELVREAYRRFYLRPGYALKRLLRTRSVGELSRKLKGGLRVLRMRRR